LNIFSTIISIHDVICNVFQGLGNAAVHQDGNGAAVFRPNLDPVAGGGEAFCGLLKGIRAFYDVPAQGEGRDVRDAAVRQGMVQGVCWSHKLIWWDFIQVDLLGQGLVCLGERIPDFDMFLDFSGV
jgi:hypothetical protein